MRGGRGGNDGGGEEGMMGGSFTRCSAIMANLLSMR